MLLADPDRCGRSGFMKKARPILLTTGLEPVPPTEKNDLHMFHACIKNFNICAKSQLRRRSVVVIIELRQS